MRLILYAQLFCSTQSLLAFLIFIISRSGFETDATRYAAALGYSLFLINFPGFWERYRQQRNLRTSFLDNKTFVLSLTLLVTVGLGIFGGGWTVYFTGLVSVIGFTIFGKTIFDIISQIGFTSFALTIAVALVFSCFVAGILMAIHGKPLFFEDLFVGSDSWRVDTLYHVANVQMFKTYGVFTTGLDGVLAVPYHYGSHLLYAALSNVFGISALQAYLIIPSVITAPLYLLTCVYVIEQVRSAFRIADHVGLIFIFIFFLLFFGYARNRFYGGGGPVPEYANLLMGSPIMFLSDSFTVSLLFVNLFVILMLKLVSNGLMASRDLILISMIAIVLFAMACYSKISTLYMLMSILTYSFIRFKSYRNLFYSLGYGLLLIVALLVFYIVRDPSYGDGGISVLYHFDQARLNVGIYLCLHFLWVWVAVIALNRAKLFSWKDIFKTPVAFLVEVLAVSVLAALGPALFLKVEWGQIYYFTEIPSWYAGILLLAFIPAIIGELPPFHFRILRWQNLLWAVAIGYGLNVFYMNVKSYINLLVGENISLRNAMLNQRLELPESYRFKTIDYLRSSSSLKKHIAQPLLSPLLDSQRVLPAKDFIEKIAALNELNPEEKSISAVYIPYDSITRPLPVKCFETPFLIPALTGMASVNGGFSTACRELNPWFIGYSLESFADAQPMSRTELLERCRQRGFSQLFLYNSRLNKFERIKI